MLDEMQQTVIDYALFGTDQLDRMAEIRHICFPESNITKLGFEAHQRFCAWLIDGPHDVIPLGAFVNGRLAGFLIAGRFKGVVSGFIKTNKLFVARCFLLKPSLLFDRSIQAKVRYVLLQYTNSPKLQQNKVVNKVSRPNSCAMLDMAVHPDFRGLGLGTQLMSKGEDIALSRGYEWAHGSVLRSNPYVIEFHRRHGYRIIEGKPGVVDIEKNLNLAKP